MAENLEKKFIEVPHEGGKITFQFPRSPWGNCYQNVANDLDKLGLRRPTSPEIASLVYYAFKNSNKEDAAEVADLLNRLSGMGFWEYTGNLFISPEKLGDGSGGTIIEHNPKITLDKGLIMDKDSLIKRLHEGDPNVKFVSNEEKWGGKFDFKTGFYLGHYLKKNPYIIARYGEEGAEKLEEIFSEYKKIRLWPGTGHEIHPQVGLFGHFLDNPISTKGFDGTTYNIVTHGDPARLWHGHGYSLGIVPSK